MTSLLLSFRSTDLRVMRISAYNFPAKIELKCISVSFVLKCVHMIFFFREIRECLKLDPDHKECFPFYKVSIIIIIIIIIIMMMIIIIITIIIIIMIKIIIIIIFTFSASYSSKFNKPLNNESKLDKQFLLQFPFHLWHSKSIDFVEVISGCVGLFWHSIVCYTMIKSFCANPLDCGQNLLINYE